MVSSGLSQIFKKIEDMDLGYEYIWISNNWNYY